VTLKLGFKILFRTNELIILYTNEILIVVNVQKANFKLKRKTAASRGFLAIARISCIVLIIVSVQEHDPEGVGGSQLDSETLQ